MSSRRVLVTGGAKGIGAAIVRALADDGFDVAFTYHSSDDAARALHASLGERGAGLHKADLSNRDAVEALAAALEGEEDGYYGFVHNAGRPYDALAAMVDRDAAEATMEVNFWAMTRLVRALARPMTAERAGRIVLIGSATAARGSQGNAIYAASKAALQGYCATLAGEVARRGVTANVVAPGYVDTDMLGPYADFRDTLAKQIPAQRYGRPEEIAAAVAFLMSDAAAYINGATLAVDGGLAANLGVQR